MTQSKTSQWPSIIEVIEEDQISQLPIKVWSLGPPVASSLQPFWFIYIVHAPHVLYSWYNINITACPTLPVLRHEKWEIVEFLDIIEVHTPLSSSIYHGLLEDYRFPIYNRSYLQFQVPRILKHPRPPLSPDWDKVMISWVYIQMHQRARTRLTQVHPVGRGRRGDTLVVAHFLATPPLRGQRSLPE